MMKVKPDYFHRKANMEFERSRDLDTIVGITFALAEIFEEMEEE